MIIFSENSITKQNYISPILIVLFVKSVQEMYLKKFGKVKNHSIQANMKNVFDKTNKNVTGKIENEATVKYLKKVVGVRPKIFSNLDDNNNNSTETFTKL